MEMYCKQTPSCKEVIQIIKQMYFKISRFKWNKIYSFDNDIIFSIDNNRPWMFSFTILKNRTLLLLYNF